MAQILIFILLAGDIWYIVSPPQNTRINVQCFATDSTHLMFRVENKGFSPETNFNLTIHGYYSLYNYYPNFTIDFSNSIMVIKPDEISKFFNKENVTDVKKSSKEYCNMNYYDFSMGVSCPIIPAQNQINFDYTKNILRDYKINISYKGDHIKPTNKEIICKTITCKGLIKDWITNFKDFLYNKEEDIFCYPRNNNIKILYKINNTIKQADFYEGVWFGKNPIYTYNYITLNKEGKNILRIISWFFLSLLLLSILYLVYIITRYILDLFKEKR